MSVPPEALAHRRLNGRLCCVVPLLYGRARLTVGPSRVDQALEHRFYDDAFDFDTPLAAVEALNAWDGTGEPISYTRRPMGLGLHRVRSHAA